MVDQLVQGGIMQKPFEIAYTVLHRTTKIKFSWQTREDQVYPLNFKMTKEQIVKDQECDENMVKMMTQIDILSKHVIGSGIKALK